MGSVNNKSVKGLSVININETKKAKQIFGKINIFDKKLKHQENRTDFGWISD